MNKIRAAIISMFSTLVLVFAVAAPAYAHTETLSHELDESEVTQGYQCETGKDGFCRQYHRRIFVEDFECDGNVVGVIWVTGDGSQHRLRDFECRHAFIVAY